MVERTAVNRDVVGSSPTRGVFLNIRLRGQAVKTSPFHGGNTGSIPVGVTYMLAELLKKVAEVCWLINIRLRKQICFCMFMPMWLNWQSS